MADDGADTRVPSPEPRDLSYDDIEPGEPIGRGGNADVTAARLPDGTNVALKEPRIQGTLRTETVEAFLAEAETWETIDDHAHVVGLVDWGGPPMPWIAMEYMDGGSLADRLADGPLDVPEAARVGREVCAAVRYAHRHGLVHLDLKPANVLFREAPAGPDVAKVGDWGLARFLAEHSGSVEGLSPQYAAPEQFDADAHGDPDDFTDIYQVGAVVYEALTGRPPFEGSGVAVMRAVLDDEPDPPTTVDPALPAVVDEVLLRALATEKRDRYETVVDLRRALERLVDGADGGPAAPTGASRNADGPSAGGRSADRGTTTSGTDDGAGGTGAGSSPAVEGGDASEARTAEGRVEGVVDFFNDTGKYGFIETDATDEDVFFHMEDIGGPDLEEGQTVSFAVDHREKGPVAVDLTRGPLDGSGGPESAADTGAGSESSLFDQVRESLGGSGGQSTGGSSAGTTGGTPRDGGDSDRVVGTVDFFNDTGGYGFIETDATDEDVFFHMEDIGGPDLEEGQEVEFDIEWAEKGPRATAVRRL